MMQANPLRSLLAAMLTFVKAISGLVYSWTPFFLTASYCICSVLFYMIIPPRLHSAIWMTFMIMQTFVTVTVLAEGISSIRPGVEARKQVRIKKKNGFDSIHEGNAPRIALIFPCYLPNEEDIVLRQMLYAAREIDYPVSKISINIVYNTPHDMPEIEAEMRKLAAQYPHLHVLRVLKSKSKADNINYFLESTQAKKADIITIFDADHYPATDNLKWVATRFLQNDVDIVQGRCCVYNYDETWLTRLVAAEFDTIYGVFHPGRASMQGYGLFGGSNGHWNASLLRSLKLQGHMLTEDIDSTLRAITSGARIAYDTKVLSYETAPATIASLTKQRLRWAQGWTQVAIRHTIPAMQRGAVGAYWRSRLGLFFLLVFREIYFYFVSQLSFMIVASFADHPPTDWEAVSSALFGFKVSWWALSLNLLCISALTLITVRHRGPFTKPIAIIAFGLLCAVYFFIVSILAIFCHFRELTKYENWNPTKRGGGKSATPSKVSSAAHTGALATPTSSSIHEAPFTATRIDAIV